jgi:hypothetical protein
VNRGTLRTEESLFSRHANPERFLTSFGMTNKGPCLATFEGATRKAHSLDPFRRIV